MKWFSSRRETAAPLEAALLGKLPCRPDFVREGCSGAAADALDLWLLQGTEQLHAVHAAERLPSSFFCLNSHPHALIGVLGPSSDSQGRQFPVAVFRQFDRAAYQAQLGQLFWGFGSFLHAAQQLISELPELALDEARARLSALPELTPLTAAASDPQLESLRSASFFDGLFGATPDHPQFYALYTLASAFAAQAGAGTALDCPIRGPLDARAWLELAAHLGRRHKLWPSFLFSPEKARLLISVASPPAELLCALAEPARVFERIWPLHTQSLTALDHARSSMLSNLPELGATPGIPLPLLAERLAAFSASLSD
jgi:type VI secretion system protein ImpM